MPNVAPRGLFGRAAGAVSAATHVYATLPGETVPSEALEVWCSGPDGVPHLVFATTPGAPDSVDADYAAGVVLVTWVAAAAADGHVVRRPDGSTVATVTGSVSSVVDPSPRAGTGGYTVTASLSGVPGSSAGTESDPLPLADPVTSLAAAIVGTGVQLGWAHPSYGQPPIGYRVQRAGVTIATVSPTLTTWTDLSPLVGTATTYSVTPVFHASTAGAAATVAVSVPAAAPASVTLAAVGANSLRLAWAHPAGPRTGYEVETQEVGGAWTALSTPASTVTQASWATTVSGSMRVRTLAAGGASAWVEVGPIAPGSTAAPATATITSWKPEASYGRMVVRATMPTSPTLTAYRVWIDGPSGGYTDRSGWINTSPGASVSGQYVSGAAGETWNVKIETRNTAGVTALSAETSYTLQTTPKAVLGAVGRTWSKPPSGPGSWRNDSQRASDELATGGQPGVRDNIATFFYANLAAQIAGLTIVYTEFQYARENEMGLTALVRPLIWMHNLADSSGGVEPTLYDGGTSEAARLGTSVNRSTETGGVWPLPSNWAAILQAGSWKGLAMYRTGGANQGNGTDANYMHLAKVSGVLQGTGQPVMPGRLLFYHLG